MAYTTKIITGLPSEIAGAVKTYLDGETITTLHTCQPFRNGAFVSVLIVFE